MSISDSDIGQNIQRARYLRGLSQVEIAKLVGVDRTAVSRIEAGTRSLAATELPPFAEALDVPIQELLRAVPKPPRSPNWARTLMRAGPTTSADEPQLAWFLELIQRACLTAQVSLRPVPDKRFFELPPGAAGELGARKARRRFGLGPIAPVAGLSGLLHRHGVLIAAARFPSASRLAGCALSVPDGPSAMLVNANHPSFRQRFTVAHELAHLLFDAENPVSACDSGEVRPGPRSRSELRADAFAGAFLLPKRVAMERFQSSLGFEQLQMVEAEYGVSRAAAVHRLRELGVLSEDEARVLRKVGGRALQPRSAPPFRLVGESLAQLVADDGARRSGDEHGYEVLPDVEVVP